MKLRLILALPFLLFSVHVIKAQTFSKVPLGFGLNKTFGFLVLADLDNDGDPEIISTGYSSFSVYNNNGTEFEFPVFYNGFDGEAQMPVHTLDVGDIDRDGFIDVVQSGGPNNRFFQILLNTHPGFNNVATNFPIQLAGTTYLGDIEGDGDLDILYSGTLTGTLVNRDGNFTNGPWLGQYPTWYATWCDLDKDSQMDVMHSVADSYGVKGDFILGNGFPSWHVKKKLSVSPVIYDASFADYDADGDLDMLANEASSSKIYNNVNGDFVYSGVSFPASKTTVFGDVNNDGYYDVIIGAAMPSWQIFETGVFINQKNGTFVKFGGTSIPIPADDNSSSAAVADIDGDGDLDIVTLSGVYRNTIATPNAQPSVPAAPSSIVSGTAVKLSWGASTDDTTPAQALTYNIAVHAADGTIIMPAHSIPSGRRQVFKLGNAHNSLSFNLSCLKQGMYYWKVQAIDAAFQGSAFSVEQSFTITSVPPVAPAALSATTISDTRIDLTWTDVSTTEDSYVIYRQQKNLGTAYYPIDTVSANTTHYGDSLQLNPNTEYLYKIVASNCAYPDQSGTETSATTFPLAFIDSQWLNLSASGKLVLLGDYDNDKDLDLLLAYKYGEVNLFRFDGNKYVDSGIKFPSASYAYWIDYNNDGYIDLIMGDLKVYKNEAGKSFSEVTDTLLPTGLALQGGISLGDYDNDGDDDIIALSGIYDNNGKGHFTRNTGLGFIGNIRGTSTWGDYDKDGDLDILSSKEISCTQNIIVVLENNNGKNFTPVEFPNLVGIIDDYLNGVGDIKWGDIDNDGYPDIIVSGQNTCGNGTGITKVYRNNKNKTFTEASNLITEIYDVHADWGDYDNDGDLDIFMYGDPFSTPNVTNISRIYRNDNGRFKLTNINYLLKSLQYGTASRGDIDNDGDLDYVIAGAKDYVSPTIIAYKNTYTEGWFKSNHLPGTPSGSASKVNSDRSVTLTWNAATDNETKQDGLTYNIYVVDETDSIIVNSYSLPDGHRKIVAEGNALWQTNLKLKNLQPGTYRWAVQAIDKSFAGSAFCSEKSFVIDRVTGIRENSDQVINIYPNPIEGYLDIAVSNTFNGIQVEIVNSLGSLVMKPVSSASEMRIDTASLPAGLYIVTVYDGATKLSAKHILKK